MLISHVYSKSLGRTAERLDPTAKSATVVAKQKYVALLCSSMLSLDRILTSVIDSEV